MWRDGQGKKREREREREIRKRLRERLSGGVVDEQIGSDSWKGEKESED